MADSAAGSPRGAGRVSRIIRRVFQAYPGRLGVRLWNGEELRFGEGTPDVILVFHDPRPLRELVLFRDPTRLAEAYVLGGIGIEGDIHAALKLKDHLPLLKCPLAGKIALLAWSLASGVAPAARTAQPAHWRQPLFARPLGARALAASRAAIGFHYDVSDEFYRLWLDEQMVYSCAYFEHPEDSLDNAQRNKLDYICRKLRLRGGERLLDIGCGWGGLICWAARHYGVDAHGITLSRNQYEHARRKIKEEGLQGRVRVELKDYRELEEPQEFDKIVSVGMFEHVGLRNLPLYFEIVRRLLAPGGLFLNQGITSEKEGWRQTRETKFINRYVFPNGELDTVSNVQLVMERAGFEILDVEALRPHYALTLRQWVRRLESRRREALRLVSESVYRVWQLYMAACALQFEEGTTGVYQILTSRRGTWPGAVPHTRRDLYG